MNQGFWTIIFAGSTVGIYLFQPKLGLKLFRKVVGITFFLELFYLVGHYMMEWPFPYPLSLLQIFITAGLGVLLGAVFSMVWPLPLRPGFERIMRTFLLVIPALGLGVGLQVLLQGNQPTQAIYLIFALAAWLGSGHIVRTE